MLVLGKTYKELETRYKELEEDYINIISVKTKIENEKIKYKNLASEKENQLENLEYMIKCYKKEKEDLDLLYTEMLDEKEFEIKNLEKILKNYSDEMSEIKILLEKEKNNENRIKSFEEQLIEERTKNEEDKQIYLKEIEKLKIYYDKKIMEEEKNNIELERIKKENKKQSNDINCYRIDLSEQIRRCREYENEINELRKKVVKKEDSIENSIEEKKEIVENQYKTENIQQNKEEEKKWDNIDLYNEYKNDLFELLKTFKSNDFKKIYKEAAEQKLIKNLEKKSFYDVLTRVNLGMPLSRGILQTVEGVYSYLMKNKIQYFKEVKNEKLESYLIKNEKNELEEQVYLFENFKPEHWYKLAKMSKDNKETSGWLRRFIFTLGTYQEEKGIVTEKQLDIIKSNYLILKNDIEEISKMSIEFLKVKKIDLKEEEIKNFEGLLNKGLENGYVKMIEVQNINFENDENAYDIYEALEILESRGIQINY